MKDFVTIAAEKIVANPACGIGTRETLQRRKEAVESILRECLRQHEKERIDGMSRLGILGNAELIV